MRGTGPDCCANAEGQGASSPEQGAQGERATEQSDKSKAQSARGNFVLVASRLTLPPYVYRMTRSARASTFGGTFQFWILDCRSFDKAQSLP